MLTNTNPYEQVARNRKVQKMVGTASELKPGLDLNAVADFLNLASEQEWEALERQAQTRPQKTQDKPSSERTRQLVVNRLRVQQRRRDRSILPIWGA